MSEISGTVTGTITTLDIPGFTVSSGVVKYNNQYYSIKTFGLQAGLDLPIELAIGTLSGYQSIDEFSGFSTSLSASLGVGSSVNLINGRGELDFGIQLGVDVRGTYTMVKPIDFDPRTAVPGAYGSGNTPLGDDGTIRVGDEYNTLDEITDALLYSSANHIITEGQIIPVLIGQNITKGLVDAIKNNCFTAGTMIDMWDGSKKPIEQIRPDDLVKSYDDAGKLVPGRVSRTFQNIAKHILDVFGLEITPGHSTLCGAGRFKGRHVPIIDILRDDGAIVREDGTLIRANTNCEVGSYEDQFVFMVVGHIDGDHNVTVWNKGRVRIGARFRLTDGTDISIAEILAKSNAHVNADGLVVDPKAAKPAPLHLSFIHEMPKPEDYILKRSGLTLAEIYAADDWEDQRPQMPAPAPEAGQFVHAAPDILQARGKRQLH